MVDTQRNPNTWVRDTCHRYYKRNLIEKLWRFIRLSYLELKLGQPRRLTQVARQAILQHCIIVTRASLKKFSGEKWDDDLSRSISQIIRGKVVSFNEIGS